MTDPLPTIESRDEAAREAGYGHWCYFAKLPAVPAKVTKSILAHARTLDLLHNRTPVDPDVEAVKRILAAWHDERTDFDAAGPYFQATLAQYKKEIRRDD